MKRTAAVPADLVIDVEQPLLAFQVLGQSLALRTGAISFFDDRLFLDDCRDIGVEVLQRQAKLIGIEALGTAPELGTLQLFDDLLEPLDLALMLRNGVRT